ncbi:carbohydrate ABC transporter permease [Parafrankia sp. EUN1f]|uniref:carbohydrate ABC transporter permease n=1 Tax=Parafrankia sp. EUN1f TaxID=102897 RepID=UPI0001C46837|nr:sugar ABC transporter permease [Parafrankia sp. EUN1f]EFC80862.1 binding-protein-dependent transport systems inner membrane component [Parafrankia sp. EUN1f]
MSGTFVEVAAIPRATTVATARRPPFARRAARGVTPYLFLLPAVGCLAVWTYRPLAAALNLSFFSWNLLPTTPKEYVGLDNYHRLLDLPELRTALWITAMMTLALMLFTVVLPTIVALWTSAIGGRGRTVYSALIFAPVLVPPVAGAALWQWMLDPHSGAVDKVLGAEINWIHETRPAQIAIVVITGWHLLGFAVLVVSAGLAGIDEEYRNAAVLDRASRWQITRWITLPLLSPTLVFLALMTILMSGTLTFPLIDTLTQGGPDSQTTNVYYLLWEYGFQNFDTGFASAAGLLFFVAFGVIAVGLIRLSDRLTFHDS